MCQFAENFSTTKMPSQTQIERNNVNTRHRRSGDEEPVADPGRVTVYNMRYCPFATRTILVLLKKGIE